MPYFYAKNKGGIYKYTVEIDCGEYIAESERIDDYEKARLTAMDCEMASAKVTAVTTKKYSNNT